MLLSAFRTDWLKQWRRPLTYGALALVVIIPVIFAIALKANPPSPPEHFGDAADRFNYFASKTGLYLGVSSLLVMSRFLLEVVVAIFAGVAVSSEANWGNLRALLVRPITRSQLLTAKLTTAALLGFLASLLVLGTGLAAGIIAFGWHPLTTGPFHQASGTILGHLVLSTLYVFWSFSPIIALAFMVSTMTDYAAGAVFAALGLYIVSQILDALTSIPASIRVALPTHYLDAWQHLFQGSGHGPTADMLRGTLLPIAYVLVFLGIAWWWFHRKDITS